MVMAQSLSPLQLSADLSHPDEAALIERIIALCAHVCEQRAQAHQETLERSRGCDRADVDARRHEATRCARALLALLARGAQERPTACGEPS